MTQAPQGQPLIGRTAEPSHEYALRSPNHHDKSMARVQLASRKSSITYIISIHRPQGGGQTHVPANYAFPLASERFMSRVRIRSTDRTCLYPVGFTRRVIIHSRKDRVLVLPRWRHHARTSTDVFSRHGRGQSVARMGPFCTISIRKPQGVSGHANLMNSMSRGPTSGLPTGT